MTYSKLIAFDRPLAGAAIAGSAGRFYSEKELAARDAAAYGRGVDSTRALADQQMVELRSDIERLGQGVFERATRNRPR